MPAQFTPAQLVDILHNMNGSTIDSFDSSYFANNGKIDVTTSGLSNFKSGTLLNGAVQNDTIYISNHAIDVLSDTAGLLLTNAARALLAHEAGHAFYKQLDYNTQPGDNADIGQKADWCLDREGRAAYFAFKYAVESGSHYVAGTSLAPNAYDAIAAAVVGLVPGSLEYEAAGIKIATNLYKGDVNYIAYCYNPTNWKPGAYIPIENLPSGGTYGGGAVWTSGYVPEPGGYWRPVNSSDVIIAPPLDPSATPTTAGINLASNDPAQPNEITLVGQSGVACEAFIH
jgi:hypothetical protein